MIIWFGGSMVLEEVLTLGTLIAFIELSRLFFGPVGEFAEYFSITQSAMSGSERIFKFLEQSSSIPNFGELEFPNTNVQIEFKNISFGYHPDDTVLHDLSFVVPANKTVAIVGYTGAGKTTITNLISRFWDPTQGQILVNNVDLRQFRLESLRQNVQSVLQDVQLFHGTIRENVTLGRNISAQDLESAGHRSRLSKVLVRLDKGWETELSNNGSNLSAGERQLVSFARVLCQNPSVLILDEATANIDSETEKWIQEALAEVVQNRTSIIIAHRLSTIKNADFILVLDQGKLVEAGTHQELLEKHGMFYNLYKLQFQVH
jgi:ATP-binding cassette subfamily B protein